MAWPQHFPASLLWYLVPLGFCYKESGTRSQLEVCTSLEIQQEPAVAEVEMSVVPVLMHQLKEL